ncbi:ArgE/DapE family deacylase [Leucobacter allii]|uniref:M20 family metallopeptidase n=1 Tax=Leucobacter allii TaxID=2932247 RepID=UPI001FD1E6AD|nr:ArgE/DapE family deacylase [Leucobacter allii]UOR02408.1 ArgE/DapE family deacylase [Leucobacter allii]
MSGARHTQIATEVQADLLGRANLAAEFLAEGIRLPSLSGDEAPYAQFIEKWADDQGWEVDRLRLDDPRIVAVEGLEKERNVSGRWNLLLRPWPRSGKPLLVINGHLDVVPPGEPESWSGAPFDGRIEDGSVYGRGAVDTKGPIAAALLGVSNLVERGIRPEIDVEFHLVLGEELSGVGTRAALECWNVPDRVLVLEPSDSRMVIASTGLIAFEVVTHGVSAHSSKPWEGQDALEHLLRIHRVLRRREQEKNAAASTGEFADVPVPAPFVVGTLDAGRFRNAVPDRATMVGRIGLLPGESPRASAEALTALVQQVGEDAKWPLASDVTVFHGLAGWRTDPRNSLVEALGHALESLECHGRPEVLTAGSDAGYYGERGIPTVLFGPGEMALAHSPNERIAVSEVVVAAAAIASAVATITIPSSGSCADLETSSE